MFVRMDIDLNDLDSLLWSGAKQRWDKATQDQKEEVWDLLESAFTDEDPTMTEVNDFIWYDCDHIFYPEEKDEAKNRKVKKPLKMKRSTIDHI
jgi:hypothetical protein